MTLKSDSASLNSDSASDQIALVIRIVDRIREIAEAFDDPRTQLLAGRAQKLLPTLERLRDSPHACLFERNLRALQTSLHIIQRCLSETLQENQDYQILGEPQSTLERLNQQLGSDVVDFALSLTADLPEEECDDASKVIVSKENPLFPPRVEEVVCVKSEDHCMDKIRELLGHGQEGNWYAVNAEYFPWNFAPRVKSAANALNSTSQSSSGSLKDRKDLCSAIRKLRSFPQQEPIKHVKVVLANLEPGDTSRIIHVAKTATTLLEGMIHTMIAPPVAVANLDPRYLFQTPMSGALKGASRFTHFLLEFELERTGDIVTMENCVEDVYLYHGPSSRKRKECVFKIPLVPGSEHAPDSLQGKVTLGDLILLRNLERQKPYAVFGNNCKDFVSKALSGGLFPPANNAIYEFSCEDPSLSSAGFIEECALRYGHGGLGGREAAAFR